jgi:hypothetical protein
VKRDLKTLAILKTLGLLYNRALGAQNCLLIWEVHASVDITGSSGFALESGDKWAPSHSSSV